MLAWKIDPNATVSVETMICTLAGVCDGAVKHDTQGFNGVDAHFGHSLASQIAGGKPLTVKQAQAALKMTRRYQRQLGGKDFMDLFQSRPVFRMAPFDRNAAAATANEAGASNRDRSLISQDLVAVFRFNYNTDILAAIKRIRGEHHGQKFWAAWDGANKQWTVPVNETSIYAIMDVAEQFCFSVEQRFLDYLARVEQKNENQKSQLQENKMMLTLNDGVNVQLTGGDISIIVDDASIMNEFKEALGA